MPVCSYKTDLNLLKRVRNRNDNASWRDFVQIYEPLLYRYARLRGLSHEDAKETVQECLALLVQQMPQFEYSQAKGEFKTWLRRVANNKIHDMFKKRRPSIAQVEESSQVRARNPSADELWDEQWKRKHLGYWLKQILSRASPTTRHAFELHVISGWSVQEVAEALSISADQVYAAKSRITQQLKRKAQSFLEETALTKH